MRNAIAAAAALSFLLALPSFAARHVAGTPGTTNNDDSCDLGNFPAATLLLPYFEVDLDAPQRRTTLISITNTSRQPQIAKVILWTDFGYPVLDFNLFLTGYDVQALNFADVLVRGVIAPPRGASIAEPRGELSAENAGNPNFAANVATACAPGALPGQLPASLIADVRAALTAGTASSCGTARIGGVHRFAAGYATIDVVATCSTTLPLDKAYWDELLYDNVLAGDYQRLGSDVEAGGNTMVHIRAVPEGGRPGEIVPTNLLYTFYDRFTPRDGPRRRDRRQPLPAAFAARFIQNESGGPLDTKLTIWREGITGVSTDCRSYAANSLPAVAELVRFDEHENATVFPPPVILQPGIPIFVPMPLTASRSTADRAVFPPFSASGDAGGWLYLNLNNGGSPEYGAVEGRRFRASQNWVVATLSNGRFAVEADAPALGNGCSPPVPQSRADLVIPGTFTIGPLPDTNP